MERLVVIGNGMAGARLAEDVLAAGGPSRFAITMFGDEPYGNYNRILLSSVLAGSHDPKDIFINPLAWYQEKGVRLHAGVPVTAIDRAARVVHGAGGVAEPYDHVVLATGSVPFVPPVEGLKAADGADKDGVFVFRTLDDCAAITAYAKKSRVAAVVGGGLLGLEAARGLLEQGLEVHVVHLMPHLMEVQLDPAASGVLLRTLRSMGLVVHLEKSTRAILGDDRVSGLAFADGSSLDCDLVVVSAGIRPNVALARACGVTVERGVVVGDDLTSPDDRHFHAVGECAQHRGRVYGLVAPLWEQARVLADRLTGRAPAAAYAGSSVSTKLKVMGVELVGDGREGGGRRGRRGGRLLRSRARHLQEAHRARGPHGRRHPAGRRLGRPDAPADVRPGGAAAGHTRGAALPRGRRGDPVGAGDARRCAGLQLQRRLQGAHRGGGRRRRLQPEGARRRDACRHRLRLLQGAGGGAARSRRRRPRAGRPGRALLRPGRAARQARADRGRARPGAAQRVRRVRGARGRTRGPRQQGGARVAAQDRVGRGVRGRARRALHQRPRARQHPDATHLQRGAPHLRRRDLRRRAPPHRRRGGQVRGADGQDHGRAADRPAGDPKGGPARRLARPRHALAATRTRRPSAPARPASVPTSAATAWATAPRSASRSSDASRASSRPTR